MAYAHVCVIEKDCDVMEALHGYMSGKKWKKAAIVSGVGSIYGVTLGNPGSYDLKILHKRKIEAPCEVVSFIGEITPKEQAAKTLPKEIIEAATSDYIIHIHMSCSHGEDGTVTGGSLREAKVLRSLAVYILELD